MVWSGVVPEIVRAKARAHDADDWLRRLPQTVSDLADRWALEPGDVFDGGTEALVVAARRADGSDAVLKIGIPRDGQPAAHEITVLGHADGRGCVRLLEADPDVEAMLLEQLGPSLNELGWPIDRRHAVLCAAAAAMWSPVPAASDLGLMSGAEKARRLIVFIGDTWERLDRPCSEAAVAHAVEAAGRRAAAHDIERSVIVHGDVHEWNALQVPDGSGFKLIDPDGLIAEPEYDLGILMREDPVELLDGDPFERARKLAALTGCDATAIWEWGVVERVSTGLLATEIGLQPVGGQMLHTADVLAATVHLRSDPK